MIIEFRNSGGSAYEKSSLGGAVIQYANTQEGREARMQALGCPADLAKRAVARHMRELANPRRGNSLQERIAAANAAVEADKQAGRLLDADLKARIAAANKLVNG